MESQSTSVDDAAPFPDGEAAKVVEAGRRPGRSQSSLFAQTPQGLAGPTKGQAKGPRWRRTSQGYYVPSHVDGGLVEQRIVEAGVLIVRFGGVTGWASLRWQGGYWFHGDGADGGSRGLSRS